jgi:hypothetical protein
MELYIGHKKVQFFFTIGWWRGLDFDLFKLNFVNLEFPKAVNLFELKIAKFQILFGFDWAN